MEPRENETKHNKEKAESKHVEKSLKTGTAKRKSTNVEEMRGEKESRNMPEFTAGEADAAEVCRYTHLLWRVTSDLWCPKFVRMLSRNKLL